MGSVDQDLKDISAAFRQQRLRDFARLGLIVLAVVLLYYGGSYVYAAATLDQAKQRGVYPSAEEAAVNTFNKGFGGAQVESITSVRCGPNNPDDLESFIWFCTAMVKLDRIPSGHSRNTMLPGSFFVRVREGWVFMSEGAFPGFVGHVMALYHLEGVQ